MEVHVEAPGGLRRQMRVRVPAERVTKAVDARLKRVASRAKVPGFRPGKAPFSVIVAQYGESARMEAVSDLVQETYPEALRKSEVNPAGMPKIDITVEKPGEPLEYVANFEVYPDIKLADLSALKIEKPAVEVTEADVDKLVENLRKARRTFADSSEASKEGDTVKSGTVLAEIETDKATMEFEAVDEGKIGKILVSSCRIWKRASAATRLAMRSRWTLPSQRTTALKTSRARPPSSTLPSRK